MLHVLEGLKVKASKYSCLLSVGCDSYINMAQSNGREFISGLDKLPFSQFISLNKCLMWSNR